MNEGTRTTATGVSGPSVPADMREALAYLDVERPEPEEVVLTVHARERFAERISAALDPEVGLRALITEALATQGQMVLRAGALARRHRVRDIEVVLSADCRTVITVYRDVEVPRRRRWRMPEVAAA